MGVMFKLYERFVDFLRKELNVVSPTGYTNVNVDTCVFCGEIVPEGRQVCPGCEGDVTSFSDIRKLCKAKDLNIKIKYCNPGFKVEFAKTFDSGFVCRDLFFITGDTSEKDAIRFIKTRLHKFERRCSCTSRGINFKHMFSKCNSLTTIPELDINDGTD